MQMLHIFGLFKGIDLFFFNLMWWMWRVIRVMMYDVTNAMNNRLFFLVFFFYGDKLDNWIVGIVVWERIINILIIINVINVINVNKCYLNIILKRISKFRMINWSFSNSIISYRFSRSRSSSFSFQKKKDLSRSFRRSYQNYDRLLFYHCDKNKKK